MLIGHVLDGFLSSKMQSLLSAGLGSFAQGAQKALEEKLKLKDLNPLKEFQKTLTDWAKNQFQDWFPSADELQRAIDDTKTLLNDVKAESKQVFSDINNTVLNSLGSGGIAAQTDGGLGKTYDNFTQGAVPTNVGALPGMGTNEVPPSYGSGNGDGGSYGGSGSGSSSGAGSSGPTPLGSSGMGGSGSGTSSGNGSGTSTGSPTTTQQPTASDLGIDPNSGAYIENQPSLGQVQIQYPDGTTETRPWPPS